MQEKIDIIQAALDKLARLGNEPHFGNSDGNVIAQKALATLQDLKKDLASEEMVEKVIDAMGARMPLIKDVITKIDPRTMEKITEVHDMPYFEMRKKYMPALAKAAIKTMLGN